MELKYKDESFKNHNSLNESYRKQENEKLILENRQLKKKAEEILLSYKKLKGKFLLANNKIVELLKEK